MQSRWHPGRRKGYKTIDTFPCLPCKNQNYLSEKEIRAMGQLVFGYLDFAERQAEREQPMTMADWAKHLDGILTSTGEKLLIGAGSVSHEDAMTKAETEYKKYKNRILSSVEKDYLQSVKALRSDFRKTGEGVICIRLDPATPEVYNAQEGTGWI